MLAKDWHQDIRIYKRINIRILMLSADMGLIYKSVVSCIAVYHTLRKALHRRFSKFLSRSKKLSLEVLVNVKTVSIIQEMQRLAQAYPKKVQLAQMQKGKYSPILDVMPQVETLRKQIKSLIRICGKLYPNISTNQYTLNEILRINSFVKKYRMCCKLLLLKLFGEYKEYQLRYYTECWRINSWSIKLFAIKYKLIDIKELKEKATIKVLNFICTNNISHNYSMFLLRIVNHEGKKDRLEESLLMLNAISNVKQHGRELKNYLNKWRANLLSPRKLIDTQERKLQLLMVLTNIKVQIQVHHSMSFEIIREESKAKRNKVNVYHILMKVRFFQYNQ
jgi:hypothetical protein